MLKLKRNIFILVCIFLAISLISNIFLFINYDNSKVNNPEEISLKNYNHYLEISKSIINNFSVTGYTEILGEKNHYLSVPIEAKETDLIGRQKLYIYKNPSNNCIIYLSISASKSKYQNDEEWVASYNYEPKIFNDKEGIFKSSYNKSYPKIQMAANSFNYKGCNISIISFSNDTSPYLAAEELTSFSNNLLTFIYEKEK